MNRGKKLIKNTFIISIGKVCTSALSFFLLPLYTSFLSTEEFGIVDLLNTLVSLLIPVVTFQIEKAVLRELIEARNDEENTCKIITTSIFVTILQCLSFTLIFFLISPFVKNKYKYYLVVNIILNIFVSLIQQMARGLDNIKVYTFGSFINAIMTIVFNILLIVFIPLGAHGMLIGTILGSTVALIYLLIKLKLFRYIKIKLFRVEILKILLKYAIPLIPNAMAWWVFSSSDKVIVSYMLGVNQNGILAASIKFSTIITTLYNIFDTSWIESVSSNINDKDVDIFFNKTLNIILRFFSSLCIGLIAFMPFIYPLMINKSFSSGYGLIPISILAALFNVLQGMVAVVYAAKKNTKSIAKTSIASAIINAITHLILIKFVGLYAAVISTLVAFMTLGIYRFIDVSKKYFKIKIEKKFLLNFSITLAIILYLYYTNNIYLNILAALLSIIYAYFINKDSFEILLNMILKKFNLKKGEKNGN